MHIIDSKLNKVVNDQRVRGQKDGLIRVMLKEILQDYILAAIYSSRSFENLIFVGGTALRKLHGLARFSEDLDFTVGSEADFEQLGEEIVNYFKKMKYDKVSYSIQKGEIVSRLLIKFEVLNAIGMSNMENEKLHIKVEVTNDKIYDPIKIPKTLANEPVLILSYPLETLMSGKLLACISRIFVKGNSGVLIKGRDFFDLLWYFENKVVPNEAKLLEANAEYTVANVAKLLDDKVASISSADLYVDLVNYVEGAEAIKIWCENFHEMYDSMKTYLTVAQ